MLVRVGRSLSLLGAAAFIAVSLCSAQAQDLNMDGDGNYNIMAPEPGTGPHHVVRNRHGRTSSRHSQSSSASQNATQAASSSIDTPQQIETFKHNRGLYASRGSSGLVVPTPLPGPTHYGPIGTPPAALRSVEQPGPTILPGTNRVIPNLPHGPETFQDRASRCAFQSSINNIHAGQFGNYMQNCAM